MNRDAELQSRPDDVRLSLVWEIVVPTVVFAAPALLFRLLGVLGRAVDKEGVEHPAVSTAVGVVTMLGIVAMAIALLVQYDSLSSRLRAVMDRPPPAWRRWALLVSMAFLLLTSILANVAAAFEGAGMLLVAAVPTFLASLASKWVAFAGLADRPDD